MSDVVTHETDGAKKLGGITGKGFLPGRSGNPSGRPKKTPITDAYARLTGQRLPEHIRLRLGLPKCSTWADAMAMGQVHAAVKGKTDAAREIADRLEGKAALGIDVNGDTIEGGITINVIPVGKMDHESEDPKAISKRGEDGS